MAPGCSGGESLNGGKHFGEVFFEEAKNSSKSFPPMECCLAVGFGKPTAHMFLFNQPGLCCFHECEVMTWRSGTTAIAFGDQFNFIR